MASSNVELKSLLKEANLVFRDKFSRVSRKAGNDKTKLKEILGLIKDLFKKFDDPNLWLEPINCDKFLLMEHIFKLSNVPDEDINEFEKVVKAFLKFLWSDVLKEPMTNMNNRSADDWNLIVRSSLTEVSRAIGNKKRAFRRKGVNLNADPAFRKIDSEQAKLVGKYRNALNASPAKIKADQNDQRTLNWYLTSFNNADTVDRFKAKLTDYATHLKGEMAQITA